MSISIKEADTRLRKLYNILNRVEAENRSWRSIQKQQECLRNNGVRTIDQRRQQFVKDLHKLAKFESLSKQELRRVERIINMINKGTEEGRSQS